MQGYPPSLNDPVPRHPRWNGKIQDIFAWALYGWNSPEVVPMTMKFDFSLAAETKALVALAFRNGPIEDLHAGRACAACNGNPEISHISDEEMKKIMKAAVNKVYSLLWQRENDSEAYGKSLVLGARYTQRWDDPEQ
jgi:hypothetical protein